MNLKKLIAGVLACCVVCGVMPTVKNMTRNIMITASAEGEAEYTEKTYEQLTYRNYGDYIEISNQLHKHMLKNMKENLFLLVKLLKQQAEVTLKLHFSVMQMRTALLMFLMRWFYRNFCSVQVI